MLLFLILIKALPGPPIKKFKTVQTEMKAYDLLNRNALKEELKATSSNEIVIKSLPENAIKKEEFENIKGIDKVVLSNDLVFWDKEEGYQIKKSN